MPGNDALVITTLLANYEIERVFIDSGNSVDILFGEAYDQMQLGEVPLKAVDTSLPELKEEAPVAVQPVEELLTVELIPGDPDKITNARSKMKEDVREQVINCLRKNKVIFAWTPQDLEGIDPGVITHHLNLDHAIKPVK
ncbi:UNVERIFIED_CONTAM: hypothetical protein Slati_0916500 [Sesamum latifolium]|uniref:Reverse transcriptase domain-containing protein n=1 Tax=Sesamum latifolium TaxID=2727402 RepID=A0AAW2XNQ1_9LAMI